MKTSIKDILSILKNDGRFQGNQAHLHAIDTAILLAKGDKANLIEFANEVKSIMTFGPVTMYNVRKVYQEKPSKSGIEEKNVTLESAISCLDITEMLWRRNGGTVQQRTETLLTCEESNGSETITWIIEEIEE